MSPKLAAAAEGKLEVKRVEVVSVIERNAPRSWKTFLEGDELTERDVLAAYVAKIVIHTTSRRGPGIDENRVQIVWQPGVAEQMTSKEARHPEERQRENHVVAKGSYDIVIGDARLQPESRLLLLDLEIEADAQAAKVVQVNLYVPHPGDRYARFHFWKKIGGIGNLEAVLQEMALVDPLEENTQGALMAFAEGMIGRRAVAEIALRRDGDSTGWNELVSTKPIATGTPPVPG
jgi:hypothetical protein